MNILPSNVSTGRIAALALLVSVLGASLLTFASPSFGAQNAADNLVDIRLISGSANINPGEQFSVAIQVEPNGQPLAGIQAFIDFDSSLLQVAKVSLDAASPLSLQLLNSFDNANGEIDFAAGSFTSLPTTTFVMANITFTAGLTDAATTLSFSRELPRQTLASIGADEVLRDLIGIEIVIGSPQETPTPSPVPTPSPTPEPTPTPTVTNTPAPTQTPTATPLPTPAPSATPVQTPPQTPLPSQTVDIKLVSDSESVIGGGGFNVSVVVEPNGQEVTGVEAYLEFDPAHVTARKVTIDSSSPLNQEVSLLIFNETGFIQIAAGALGPGPNTTFTMANVEFEALSVDEITELTLSDDSSRKTVASFGGFEIQRTLIGTSVTITKPPVTPVPPQPLVDLMLTGPDDFVVTSSVFNVAIIVEPNGQDVAGVQTFLNFDPNEITVDTIVLADASTFGTVLIKTFDNVAGTILIAVGTFGSPVAVRFELAEIGFRAAPISSLAKIVFSTSTPRNTIASIHGVETQRDTTGIAIQIGPHSDLSITKQATPRTVRAGDMLTYTLNIQNIGPETAVDVKISDALAPGMVFVDAVPSQGECSEIEGNVVCNLGELSVGGSAQVEILVTAAMFLLGEEIVNEADVGSPRFDPINNDNTASATVEIPAVSEIGLVAMAGAFAAILLAKIARVARQG